MFLKNPRTAKDMGYVAIFTLKQVGNSSYVTQTYVTRPSMPETESGTQVH